MQLNQFNNIKDFWQNAQDCLRQYVAEHNALLDVLQTLLHIQSGQWYLGKDFW